MKSMSGNLSALKISLPIGCILLLLVGCDQTATESTDTVAETNPVSEVAATPSPETDRQRPQTMLPSEHGNSWEITAPFEYEDESLAPQDEQDFSTEEYADAQAQALLDDPPEPSVWLDQIKQRVLVEEPEEAKAAMDAFYLVYPDYPVDEFLVDQIYGVEE